MNQKDIIIQKMEDIKNLSDDTKARALEFLNPFLKDELEIEVFEGFHGDIMATVYDHPYYFELTIESDGTEIFVIEKYDNLIFYCEYMPVKYQ